MILNATSIIPFSKPSLAPRWAHICLLALALPVPHSCLKYFIPLPPTYFFSFQKWLIFLLFYSVSFSPSILFMLHNVYFSLGPSIILLLSPLVLAFRFQQIKIANIYVLANVSSSFVLFRLSYFLKSKIQLLFW